MGPSVSNANGTNWWDLESAEYFLFLNSAAASAADPATWIEWLRLLGARVSITVTSHVRHLPEDHGINVRPSGRSSVPGIRPVGSFTVGIPALAKARHMISLIWLWRDSRPMPRMQDRPWRPRSSTMAPQTQVWGLHMGGPSLKPTLTRTASSSSRRPHEAMGRLSANHRHEVMPPQVIALYPKESGPTKREWPYTLKQQGCPNASVLKQVRPMEVWHCRYDTKHPVYDILLHLREASHHQGWRTGGLEWLPLRIKKPMVRALPHFILPDPLLNGKTGLHPCHVTEVTISDRGDAWPKQWIELD